MWTLWFRLAAPYPNRNFFFWKYFCITFCILGFLTFYLSCLYRCLIVVYILCAQVLLLWRGVWVKWVCSAVIGPIAAQLFFSRSIRPISFTCGIWWQPIPLQLFLIRWIRSKNMSCASQCYSLFSVFLKYNCLSIDKSKYLTALYNFLPIFNLLYSSCCPYINCIYWYS